MRDKKKKQFLVAGLGLFGTSVALTLQEMGYDVLGVDNDESVVQNGKVDMTAVEAKRCAESEHVAELCGMCRCRR